MPSAIEDDEYPLRQGDGIKPENVMEGTNRRIVMVCGEDGKVL
jgi:hypothetical protein